MGDLGIITAVRRLCQGIALVLTTGLPVAAAQCPPPGLVPSPVEVRFETGIAEPVWRNDRTRRELSALAGIGTGLKGFQHSGLTQSRTELRITPSYRWATYPDGRACMMLTRVEASWRIVGITVDIARQYAPGTCQYDVVRDHEARHVAIAQAVYRDWMPKIQARLTDTAKNVAPILVSDANRAAGQITARMMENVQAVQDAYHADLRTRQAVIDTEQSYRAESDKCPKW